jgi:hypothetical protein
MEMLWLGKKEQQKVYGFAPRQGKTLKTAIEGRPLWLNRSARENVFKKIFCLAPATVSPIN